MVNWQSKLILRQPLRYATKRNGYHGGCSPAEALVPMVAYRYGAKAAEGWYRRSEDAPEWWCS